MRPERSHQWHRRDGLGPAALLSLCVFLAGCSRLSLMYRYADRWIVSRLTDRFALTSEQKARIKPIVRRELRALLRDVAPRFNAHFERLLALIRLKELASNDCTSFFDSGRALFREVKAHQEAAVVEGALLLTPEQFVQGKVAVEKEAQEEAKTLSSEKARRKELRKRDEWWLDFIGLDPREEQKSRIERYLAEVEFPFELERNHRIAEAGRLSLAAQKPDTLKAYLHQFLQNPSASQGPELRQAIEKFRKATDDLHCDLLRTLSEKQKTAIQRKVRDLIEQIDVLRLKEGSAD